MEYDGNDFSKLDVERKTLINAVFNEDQIPILKKIAKSRVAPLFVVELEELIGRYFDIQDPKIHSIFEETVEALGKN